MAYRCGDRYQMGLLPQSIEDYVSEDNPVRAYDAIVDALDFNDLGIDVNFSKVGNPEYDPKTMLKLLVYGYSYGVKSSRKLERECHHNIAFMWLMGGLRPDHKTIAEFRRRNKKALQKVLRKCVRICIKLDLIVGNVLFADGTKIRANAARHHTHDRAYYERHLADIESRISLLLAECEAVDREEEGSGSYVKMDKELTKARNLKDRIKQAIDAFETGDRELINRTDPDCAIMKSVQGSHASYNVQSVVDDKYGLIVHAEAVSDATDIDQFARQIDQANEQMGKSCNTACADAGYAHTAELEKIEKQEIAVIVPSQRQALHEDEGLFSKHHFAYDADKDCYVCPEGHRLGYQFTDKKTGKRHYRITDRNRCLRCQHYGQCTRAKNGRKIVRLQNEEAKQRFEALYEEASSQEVYGRRKMRAELPFGHIKRNLKTDAFLLRGKDGAQAETSLLATCFNVTRMITIFGVGVLLTKLGVLNTVPVFL